MKKTLYIYAMALAAAIPGAAQDLTVPQQDGDVPAATETPEAQAPAPQAKYNTPSKSYKDERNDIRRGNSLYEKEKYHEALEEYDKALMVNSGSIRGRYNKALTLLQLQSDDNKGTANDPRVLATQILEGLIADAKEYDTDIARKSYYNLGNMAFNDEQYDRSIAMYKSALRIDPDDMDTRENLRLAQLKKQEQEQNQDQNQDQQQQQEQQQQQQQEQQQDQQQEQQQQEQQQQQQPMTNSAQQILQTMQNRENATRKKVKENEPQAPMRSQPEKPW